MLVYKRNKYPIDVEFFLHHGSDLIRIGVFADTMLSVIIGFDIKGHRATSQLAEIGGLAVSLDRFRLIRKTIEPEGFSKPPVCPGFSPCFYVKKL